MSRCHVHAARWPPVVRGVARAPTPPPGPRWPLCTLCVLVLHRQDVMPAPARVKHSLLQHDSHGETGRLLRGSALGATLRAGGHCPPLLHAVCCNTRRTRSQPESLAWFTVSVDCLHARVVPHMASPLATRPAICPAICPAPPVPRLIPAVTTRFAAGARRGRLWLGGARAGCQDEKAAGHEAVGVRRTTPVVVRPLGLHACALWERSARPDSAACCHSAPGPHWVMW